MTIVKYVVGSGDGEQVEVEGSFDNWQTRQPMQKSGKDFTIVKLLPPGVYQVSCLLWDVVKVNLPESNDVM